MDGTAILALVNGLSRGGVLTLQPGSALNSARVDALLSGIFGGKLVATLGAPKTDATSVSFPDAKLATANFAFYPKGDSIPAPLIFATGKEGQLDLALTATLADGWTFAASFPEIGLDNASINALALSAVTVAVDSALSANDALLTATIDSAKSAIAQFDWLLGASVTIKGALGFVTNTKGAQAPSFTLSSAPIQGPAVSGFTFDVYLNVRCAPAAEALPDGSVPLLPAVDLTAEIVADKLTLPIRVSITGKNQSLYPIRLDPTAQVPHLTSLDDLSGFTFGSSPGAVLADAKTPIGALSLDFLFATFDATNKGFSNVVFKISLGTQWKVIDDIFKLDGLFAQISVPALLKGGSLPKGSASFSVALGAIMEISTAKLVATATFPDQTLSVALEEGSTIDINAFMKRFARDVSLPGSSTLVIREFDALADIKGGSYHLSVEADGELSVIPKFTLTEVKMSIDYASGAVASFDFACNFTLANAPLVLDVSYSGGTDKNWIIQGGSEPGKNINLSELVADILSIFEVTLPGDLPKIVLSVLDMRYESGPGSFAFDCSIGYVEESDPILKKIEGKIAIAYAGRETKTWTGQIEGTIEIGNKHLLTAKLDFQKTKTLSLQWKAEKNEKVEIADICALVGIPSEDIPDIPSDLDLALIELDGIYDITNQALMLGVVSQTWGNADVVLSKNSEGKWDFFFALKTGKTISLSSLPLIGSPLSSVGDVSLDDIQFYVAQPLLTKDGAGTIAGYVDTLSSLSGAAYPKPPADGLSAKAALNMNFHVADKTTPLSLGTAKPSEDNDGKKPAPTKQFAVSDAAPTGASTAPAQVQTATGSDSTKWFTIQKSFGPVSIQKVGVRYEESTLWALMDASLDAGGLTIALHGLGMGSGLKSFDPKFTVSGIDVTLAEGPVEARGGLIGTIDPVNLYGELMLKTPEFALGALAGFAMVDDHPSFFLYATLLAPPLGGPAFFYVTGLAAGIGLNRKLVIPAVDGVATFPFIEWAMGSGAPTSVPGGDTGKQVTDVLSTLATSGVVAPQIGEYWLVAGVHFTSFELVESFALLTVAFGTDFEIDLLGLSRLKLPPTGTPVALIEIQLKASFSPSAGLLAISGQLSPNSYVLSESCHLTGGFAFYSWFSGEHEGDFVVSIGGYNPRFNVPAHYPVVPRLGLRWQVNDQLTISGDEYFAITSTAVMAGGGLSAVWDGGPVSAWFSVEADFLLIYQPFHYYLSASCQLGASFSIDLLFTTVTITIHLGVGIEIWGPEFAGVATVDLSIISFSIEFGDSGSDSSQTIKWHEFLDRLMPKKPAQSTQSAKSRVVRRVAAAIESDIQAVAPDPVVNAAVVQIKMTNGLLKTLSDTGEDKLNYIVDGQHFQMEVNAIPCKEALFPQDPEQGFSAAPIDVLDDLQPKDDHGKIIQPNILFGVGPVGLSPNDFDAKLSIEIDSPEDVKFHAIRILKNVAKAFWEKPSFSDDGKSVPQLDPLNDTTIKNVLVGFQIIPFVTPPDQTRPIDLEYLKYTVDEEHIESFRWSSPIVPGADNFSTETVAGTLDDPNHAAKIRPALLRAIKSAGFPVAQTIDAGDLGDASKTYLGDPPVLALLGEAK
jgi:uncharacterized protein DUF6603